MWLIISFICGEIAASVIYFAFPSNRNISRLKRRAKFVAVEIAIFFVVVQLVLILILPSAFLFSSAEYNEIGETSINIRSPKGLALQKSLNCNYTKTLAEAQNFFNCTVNVSAVDFYYGGAPRSFPGSAAGMTIYRNVFLQGPDYCPRTSLLVHELFHVYQYDRGWWSASVLAHEMYLQATLRWNMYEYGDKEDLQKAFDEGKPFSDFNPEQQASIVEDYFVFWRQGQRAIEHARYVDPLLKNCLNTV